MTQYDSQGLYYVFVHLSFTSFRSKNSLIFFLIEIEFGKELKRKKKSENGHIKFHPPQAGEWIFLLICGFFLKRY